MANSFIKWVSGQFQQVFTKATSAGAGDAGVVPELSADGKLDQTLLRLATAGGGASANLIPQLDASGLLPESVMPVGIGKDAASVVAGEALSANNLVNIYSDAGTAKVRKADYSSGKPAHGYVTSAVASGATATVFFEGRVTGLTGLTPGQQHLGTNGAVVATPGTGAGAIAQAVGFAYSTTEFTFEPQPHIVLAA